MRHPVVLDLETKHTFRQFSNPARLGISVVGIYDFKTGKLSAFYENKVHKLFPILESASYIVGFNIDAFDFKVLQSYYPGDISKLSTFDMLEDVRVRIGRRISLNDIAVATLDKGKSGHGLQAIELYKEGKLDELRQYCLDDVTLTRDIFQHGAKHGSIYYRGGVKKVAVEVEWNTYLTGGGKKQVSLTLPF